VLDIQLSNVQVLDIQLSNVQVLGIQLSNVQVLGIQLRNHTCTQHIYVPTKCMPMKIVYYFAVTLYYYSSKLEI